MKVDKFNGSKDEDYDIWWADMQAFFELHNFTEQEKVKLFNAHLGSEARRFIQEEDLVSINTVAKMDETLKGTFSQKQDWHNILMNIQQRADEDVRPFSVRLRVAARKCGHKGDNLDKTSVNCLKRGCAPYLSTLLDNCLPHTPYDEIVEHAIQFERKQESLKKPSKRKFDKLEEIDAIDVQGDSEDDEKGKLKIAKLEIVKKEFANSLKQVKDNVASKYDELRDTINNMQYNNRDRHQTSNNNTNGRYKPYDNNRGSNTKPGGYINACLHCAKPNHKFSDCKTASETQKNAIKSLLRAKKFDFKNLIERANKFLKEREQRDQANSTPSHTVEPK